ncbi:MAG: arsenic resistance N-acetyltransferase ArsN2 [Bacillota bacterium]
MNGKELEQAVLARYDSIARGYLRGGKQGCGCGSSEVMAAKADGGSTFRTNCCQPASERSDVSAVSAAEPEAQESGLGCARIADLVELFPGETLLDIGSGPGFETIALARRVDPAPAFGLDLTPAMVEVATENAKKAGVANVRFLNGPMENIPLEDECIDVVVSNCVINLSLDKRRALEETRRVLRPGGRVAIADIVWRGSPPPWVRSNVQAWASCVGGALEADEYPRLMAENGFIDIKLDILQTLNLANLSCCIPESSILEGRQPGSSPRCCADLPEGLALASALVTARKPGTPDHAVEIHRAQPADLNLTLRLLQAAGLPTAGVSEHLADFLVARTTNGRIVGIAGLERYPSSALLRSLAVLPSWRGQGIGRRLVASQLARLATGTPVCLLTTTAEAYFRTLGFEVVSRDEVCPEVRESSEFRGACPQSAVAMRLVCR